MTNIHPKVKQSNNIEGYNLLLMSEEDQEKTPLVTSWGLHYYKAMPFSLKDMRATCQKLVSHMFSKQIDKNIEVYMDNMLVKSRGAKSHLNDL